MLPAQYGDCLWIEYGRGAEVRRMLVDCGTLAVWPLLKAKIQALPKEQRRFELFVVTHIDIDHIGGAVSLLREAKSLGVSFGDVWFNGHKHLIDTLGAVQGEELTTLIEAGLPWNRLFGGRAAVVPDLGPLPSKTFDLGTTLTLVSPTPKQLSDLEPEWKKTCEKAGLVAGHGAKEDPAEPPDDLLGPPDVETLAKSKFKSDTSLPNGSSIAFVAEFEGARALLTGDAFPTVIAASLSRLEPAAPKRLSIQLLKLAHHGSRSNTDADLVARIDARHVLVSSNGVRFSHPNLESVARAIANCPRGLTLTFNYRTKFNDMWDDAVLKAKHGYAARYRADGEATIATDLS